MNRLIPLMLTSVLLTACVPASNVINTAFIIDQNGGITETVLKANLSKEEIAKVLKAESDMLKLRDNLDVVKDNPALILDFDGDVANAVLSYLSAKEVYLNHKAEYSEDDILGLESFHESMTQSYDTYQSFKKQGKYLETAKSALELAKMGAKVAIILGG